MKSEENGIRILWAHVVLHALKTAMKPLPKKNHPGYDLQRSDKARAKRFFKYPSRYNLPLACAVLDMDIKRVSKEAINKIEAGS